MPRQEACHWELGDRRSASAPLPERERQGRGYGTASRVRACFKLRDIFYGYLRMKAAPAVISRCSWHKPTRRPALPWPPGHTISPSQARNPSPAVVHAASSTYSAMTAHASPQALSHILDILTSGVRHGAAPAAASIDAPSALDNLASKSPHTRRRSLTLRPIAGGF